MQLLSQAVSGRQDLQLDIFLNLQPQICQIHGIETNSFLLWQETPENADF